VRVPPLYNIAPRQRRSSAAMGLYRDGVAVSRNHALDPLLFPLASTRRGLDRILDGLGV
jgi:hypothetical protein